MWHFLLFFFLNFSFSNFLGRYVGINGKKDCLRNSLAHNNCHNRIVVIESHSYKFYGTTNDVFFSNLSNKLL